MNNKKFSNFALTLAAGTMLAACQTTSSAPSDAQTRTSKIDSVLERASNSAAARGETGNSLMIQEKMYKRNSNDPQAALKYARALRESDYLNRAALVLAPFANQDDAAHDIKTEYAAVQLALGRYDSAEQYAQEAIVQNPADYKAYHFLGIALDAKGQHKEAERAFRKGLDNWDGDPTPIMNNLALNLAAQGFLNESTEILEKAAAVSPGRREVERNLRIVNALKESNPTYNPPPKPTKKPFAPLSDLNLEPQMPPPAAPVEDVIAEEVVIEEPIELKAEEKVEEVIEEIKEEAEDHSALEEELINIEEKIKELNKSVGRDDREKLMKEAKEQGIDPLQKWRSLDEERLELDTRRQEIEKELKEQKTTGAQKEIIEKVEEKAEIIDDTTDTAPVITVEAQTIELPANDKPIVIGPQ